MKLVLAVASFSLTAFYLYLDKHPNFLIEFMFEDFMHKIFRMNL